MLELAALKYRKALADAGGPIAKIVSSPVSVFGHVYFQADAFLTQGLSRSKPRIGRGTIADGTGSSTSPTTARNMAVSEALENWAFHCEHEGPNARRYGFHEDCSTDGMAAYPSFFKRRARRRSHLEALEQLAVVSWWSGHIDASPARQLGSGITMLRLHHPAHFGEVVIIYRKSKSGHCSYGYAAGECLQGACDRAVVELAHNENLITRHKLFGATRSVENHWERRCLFYADHEGHDCFLARIATGPSKASPGWSTIVDNEIRGPWSRYATVWRTMPRLPTQEHLDPRSDFFYW